MALQAIKYTHAAESQATLEILDQLLLPHRSVYIPIESAGDAWNAIKRMNVRGAPAIAIVAALGLAVELGYWDISKTSAPWVKDEIFKKLEYLVTSRPTAVNLWDAVRKLKRRVAEAEERHPQAAAEIIFAYVSAAEEMLVKDLSDNEAIGANGVEWIIKTAKSKADRLGKVKILTHCNTG